MASVSSDAERATSESNPQTPRFERFGTQTVRTAKPDCDAATRGLSKWRGTQRRAVSVPRDGTRTEP